MDGKQIAHKRGTVMSRTRSILGATAVVAATFALVPAAQANNGGEPKPPPQPGAVVVALTSDDRVLTIDASQPKHAVIDVPVTGLRAGEDLVGLDRRPKDGILYGIARAPQSTWLYAIDATTGVATPGAQLVGVTGAPIVLLGGEFGVDFNPAADAIRIVSDGGQNLRVLPENRTVEGVARPVGTTFVDGTLNEGGEAATGIGAAAYTGNDTDPATPTKLYVIDTSSDRLLVQDPPNAGTLGGALALQKRTDDVAGFDIVTTGGKDVAYAALSGDGWKQSRLVLVDLATGGTWDLGKLPKGASIEGIAL
jgi:hypothetical protein